MRLDRNTNPDGRGKYALVLLRNLPAPGTTARSLVDDALEVLERNKMLDYGEPTATGNDFFVLRLRDRHAGDTLDTYAALCHRDGDPEFAHDVATMAVKAHTHPQSKKAD